jgi:SAM-dependent methyltransferase
MLDRLERRAARAGLADRIHATPCSDADLGLDRWVDRVDFVAALHVIHEMADAARALREIHATLKPGGRMLVLEPRGHVGEAEFRLSLERARNAGFVELRPPEVRRNRVALFEKRP